MKTISLTPREFRRMRRFIARPSGPTQAMTDLMNTSRQPAVEETLRAENARLQRIADHAPGFEVPIITSLRADNAALKARLEWREGQDGTTHSESCYQWHWHCAMQRIEGMEAKLADALNARRTAPAVDDPDGRKEASRREMLSAIRKAGSHFRGDVARDRDEWRTQHENLLAMYRAVSDELAALKARPTISADVVEAVDWATKMIEKTGVEGAAGYYWLDSRPGKPPHSAPPTQSQEVRMAEPNSMTGYDAATVEACAKVAKGYREGRNGFHPYAAHIPGAIAEAIRALPIAPPAPLQVTADDVAQGTFACPICGKDTPHYHSAAEVAEHRATHTITGGKDD